MKGNQLESGTYTAIFEIFVIGDAGGFRVDDTIIYQVYGDSVRQYRLQEESLWIRSPSFDWPLCGCVPFHRGE